MRKYKGPNILAVFSAQDLLLKGIHELKRSGYENFLVYSPVPHHDIEHALHRPRSPVRVFTLIGGLTGFLTGWALTIGSAMHYPLIVGGKPIISIPPFGVLAYILTILFGALATMMGFLLNARLPQLRLTPNYDERLSSDHYGIQVFGDEESLKKWARVLKKTGAIDVRKFAPTHRHSVNVVTSHVLLFFVGVFVSTITLASCTNDNGEIGNYRYRTDMHEQPSFKKQEDPRPPVKGTVPVSGYELPIKDSLTAVRLVNPVRLSSRNADTAKVLYETYCLPCHGLGAKGDGPVAAKFQTPPDLTLPRYRRAPDGYLYYVMRHGHLIMPPYYEGVKSRERWLIVQHLRTLQRLQ